METSKGFLPIARADAQILILGSLPGRKSLAEHQYYAHPRNAFWSIMQQLYGISGSYAERCGGIMDNKIALWDVLSESLRPGSLDADIHVDSATPNDFSQWLCRQRSLRLIAFNGKRAEQLFKRLVHLPAAFTADYVALPSTSPAYASLPVSAKLDAWRKGLTERA